MMQVRWFCQSCKREWVFVREWDEVACPVCKSTAIESVRYQPAFPGADIPRDVIVAQPVPVVVPEQRNSTVFAPELS